MISCEVGSRHRFPTVLPFSLHLLGRCLWPLSQPRKPIGVTPLGISGVPSSPPADFLRQGATLSVYVLRRRPVVSPGCPHLPVPLWRTTDPDSGPGATRDDHRPPALIGGSIGQQRAPGRTRADPEGPLPVAFAPRVCRAGRDQHDAPQRDDGRPGARPVPTPGGKSEKMLSGCGCWGCVGCPWGCKVDLDSPASPGERNRTRN